jgi:hypothetical protein
MTPQDFKNSQEASFRRVIRDTIRRTAFSKGDRDVILALVNHWFIHRHSPKGVIHPGRDKLARKAGVSIKTVSRCLDMLRHHGVLTATAHLEGLHWNATEYQVSIPALTALRGMKKEQIRVDGGTFVPTSGRDKMSHRSCEVIAFPKVSGGRRV